MSIEAMKQALEALENHPGNYKLSKDECVKCRTVEDTLRTAIEQAEKQMPVGKVNELFDEAVIELCGFDRELLVYTTPPAAPVQEHEHIVHSNGRYSPLLTRMMNKRTESNIKQVIHLYDEPSAAHVQEPKQGEIFCGVDFSDGVLSVSVLRRRPDEVAELLHSEQIELQPTAAQRQWVGLTDEEAEKLRVEEEFDQWGITEGAFKYAARAIAAKLREKNGGAV